MKRPSSMSRGFSLMEIMVVLAIVAILGTVSVMWFVRAQKDARLNAVAASVMGRILEARTEALTGRVIANGAGAPAGAPGEFQGWAAQPMVRSAGFRVTSATTFEVFVDQDTQPGGEEVIHETDFMAQSDSNRISFAPNTVGRSIRFQRDGRARGDQEFQLIENSTQRGRQITVTGVGQVRIEPLIVQ